MGISGQKIPGCPAQMLVSLGFEGHTELFGPRPHQKISGPESLGLCSFFVPDMKPFCWEWQRGVITRGVFFTGKISREALKSVIFLQNLEHGRLSLFIYTLGTVYNLENLYNLLWMDFSEDPVSKRALFLTSFLRLTYFRSPIS